MAFKLTGIFFCWLSLLVSAASANIAAQDKVKSSEEILQSVQQYCGACHKVPPPYVMPKKYWPRAVDAMAKLAEKKLGRAFIPNEIQHDITAYYYGSSPEYLPVLPYINQTSESLAIEVSSIAEQAIMPLIVNINAVSLYSDSTKQFLICDAQRDQVSLLSQVEGVWQEKVLANVKVPSRTEVVDYDQDGDNDIIIAALGLLPPSPALAGKILLLRQSSAGEFIEEVILDGVGRITDARTADMDNDGDLDIAVAIFGGGNVGEIVWLENIGAGQHVKHDIVKASGALNVSLADLNNDGKMDIVSLIAQEYEMVFGLINQGKGKFEQVAIAEAPHPMFGSTGMSMVDLDADNDIDILFTNGDAHDLQMDPKPYHGVQWLENKGKLNFQFHNVGRFYGAATAVAGDIDNDGDLDIVAGSWNNYWHEPERQTLVWFENDGQQNFTQKKLLDKPQSIVSFELTDVTGNGRLDIVAGVFRMDLLMEQLMGKQDKADDILKFRVVLLENKSVNKPAKTQ